MPPLVPLIISSAAMLWSEKLLFEPKATHNKDVTPILRADYSRARQNAKLREQHSAPFHRSPHPDNTRTALHGRCAEH